MSEKKIDALELEIEQRKKEIESLRHTNNHVQDLLKESASLIIDSRKDLDTKFQSLCSQVLVSGQKSFLETLAPLLNQFQSQQTHQLQQQSSQMHTLVQPLSEQMKTMKGHLDEMEKLRVGAYEGLREQVLNLAQGQKELNEETQALSTALRAPHVRGCWGEMQLRRVVELAGMMPYCDFVEQPSMMTDGKKRGIKPDMIIRLPGHKHIIVDAKAPLLHYLEATSSKNKDEYNKKIKEHAKSLATHIHALSDKKYWSCQTNSVEMTVLFLPGEAFLSAALESQVALLETSAQKNIILATPTILIALLKTIAQGWRQDVLSRQTQKIIDLARDMWNKIESFQKCMDTLGKSLNKSNTSYQEAMGLLNHSIAPTAEQLGSNVPHEHLTEKNSP